MLTPGGSYFGSFFWPRIGTKSGHVLSSLHILLKVWRIWAPMGHILWLLLDWIELNLRQSKFCVYFTKPKCVEYRPKASKDPIVYQDISFTLLVRCSWFKSHIKYPSPSYSLTWPFSTRGARASKGPMGPNLLWDPMYVGEYWVVIRVHNIKGIWWHSTPSAHNMLIVLFYNKAVELMSPPDPLFIMNKRLVVWLIINCTIDFSISIVSKHDWII